MKKIAILQSNYIPWKGYFDLINKVDEFILYDDMQYTKRDWRNRNKIKTVAGLKWLSIGVEVKGKYFQKINETQVSEKSWAKDHWNKLNEAYKKAPYFADYKTLVQSWYDEAADLTHLSDINYCFIKNICIFLGIETKISWSSDYQLVEGKSERLLQLCIDAGGSTYISGPSAKDYLDTQVFEKQDVDVEWMKYDQYPIYSQCHGEFEHGVSIIDVIFNCGPDTKRHILTQ